MIKANDARELVIKSFDLSDALMLIAVESKNGKLECFFDKGNCLTKNNALDYRNGLKSLGYNVRAYGPYRIKISWDLFYEKD